MCQKQTLASKRHYRARSERPGSRRCKAAGFTRPEWQPITNAPAEAGAKSGLMKLALAMTDESQHDQQIAARPPCPRCMCGARGMSSSDRCGAGGRAVRDGAVLVRGARRRVALDLGGGAGAAGDADRRVVGEVVGGTSRQCPLYRRWLSGS